MKLSVHGSRTLKDERVEILLREEIQRYGITHIVTHAEPEGVCGVVRELCKTLAMPLTLHFLNFKHLRGAFEHRSKAVLKGGDRAIFIHDGVSRGTSNELALARKMDMKFTYHQIDIAKHESSVGFPIEKEWEIDTDELDVGLLSLNLEDEGGQ
ncbi:hypothetical protein [Desulfonatronovibrio hydrogenovorans]|uniref:hypothetical protein n=1 Tax=Desulfonatronovibrio hydrogenovorans TaxID=53245 RepID=UPI00048F1F2B|nr:hypothetical protein [Desulfonatronovibrio hydrogenovorans]